MPDAATAGCFGAAVLAPLPAEPLLLPARIGAASLAPLPAGPTSMVPTEAGASGRPLAEPTSSLIPPSDCQAVESWGLLADVNRRDSIFSEEGLERTLLHQGAGPLRDATANPDEAPRP